MEKDVFEAILAAINSIVQWGERPGTESNYSATVIIQEWDGKALNYGPGSGNIGSRRQGELSDTANLATF